MQTFAHIVAGATREIITLPAGLVPGRDLYTPEFAAELVACGRDVREGWLYDGQGFVAPPVLPEPVPAEISAAQAEMQLLRAGLLDGVKTAIEKAGGEAAIWFLRARTWQRANPYVAQMAGALGLTEAQVDDLFRQAVKIQA